MFDPSDDDERHHLLDRDTRGRDYASDARFFTLDAARTRMSQDRAEYQRAHYLENREKMLARMRGYYQANLELMRERGRDKARRKALAEPGAQRNKMRAWRAANPDKAAARGRKYRHLPESTRVEPSACECCGRVNVGGRRLALDHDHATGVFRCWLCNLCNTAIGKLGDTLESVERAVAYLKRSRQ